MDPVLSKIAKRNHSRILSFQGIASTDSTFKLQQNETKQPKQVSIIQSPKKIQILKDDDQTFKMISGITKSGQKGASNVKLKIVLHKTPNNGQSKFEFKSPSQLKNACQNPPTNPIEKSEGAIHKGRELETFESLERSLSPPNNTSINIKLPKSYRKRATIKKTPIRIEERIQTEPDYVIEPFEQIIPRKTQSPANFSDKKTQNIQLSIKKQQKSVSSSSQFSIPQFHQKVEDTKIADEQLDKDQPKKSTSRHNRSISNPINLTQTPNTNCFDTLKKKPKRELNPRTFFKERYESVNLSSERLSTMLDSDEETDKPRFYDENQQHIEGLIIKDSARHKKSKSIPNKRIIFKDSSEIIQNSSKGSLRPYSLLENVTPMNRDGSPSEIPVVEKQREKLFNFSEALSKITDQVINKENGGHGNSVQDTSSHTKSTGITSSMTTNSSISQSSYVQKLQKYLNTSALKSTSRHKLDSNASQSTSILQHNITAEPKYSASHFKPPLSSHDQYRQIRKSSNTPTKKPGFMTPVAYLSKRIPQERRITAAKKINLSREHQIDESQEREQQSQEVQDVNLQQQQSQQQRQQIQSSSNPRRAFFQIAQGMTPVRT